MSIADLFTAGTSTISPSFLPASSGGTGVPTLAQVLQSNNTASRDIAMNSQSILASNSVECNQVQFIGAGKINVIGGVLSYNNVPIGGGGSSGGLTNPLTAELNAGNNNITGVSTLLSNATQTQLIKGLPTSSISVGKVDIQMGNGSLVGPKDITLWNNDVATPSSTMKLEAKGSATQKLYVVDQAGNSGSIYDSYFNPPPTGSGTFVNTATGNLNMNGYNITTANLISTNNLSNGSGGYLAISMNNGDILGNKSLQLKNNDTASASLTVKAAGASQKLTITDGTNIGQVYDSYFNPPAAGVGASDWTAVSGNGHPASFVSTQIPITLPVGTMGCILTQLLVDSDSTVSYVRTSTVLYRRTAAGVSTGKEISIAASNLGTNTIFNGGVTPTISSISSGLNLSLNLGGGMTTANMTYKFSYRITSNVLGG